MTALDLRDATPVGFSMGGGEVVRYLATYGADRVAEAVLAAAVPPYLYKSDDNPGLDDATISQLQAGATGDRPAFLDTFATAFFSTSGLLGKTLRVSAARRQYAVSLALPASLKATLDCITAFGRTDFRGDVAKVPVPTLVIHGDSDAVVPFEVFGQRSAQLIPGARLHVIKDGPHVINAFHAEEFNAALRAFLRS